MPDPIWPMLLLAAWIYAGIPALAAASRRAGEFGRAAQWINLAALVCGPPVLLGLWLYRALGGTIHGAHRWFRRRPEEDAEANGAVRLLDSRGQTLFDGDALRPGGGEAVGAVKELIGTALKRRASDLFIDPTPNGSYRIRMRIDGALKPIREFPPGLGNSMISSLKVAAGMDISERRRPQDGSFSAQTASGGASFRVASVGAFGGEKISVRILGGQLSPRTLRDLGLEAADLKTLESAIKLPSGMILICGPTGSGKTSTLYAMLQSLDYSLKNVISIEDPVETVLPQVSQMEVNARAEITFAELLRNALRQNPDVICLGEIRDEETAQIAVRAAQTGHLIIATVHSNDNFGTLDRLMTLGVPMRTLAESLHVLVSQRLVRTLCPHCREKTAPTPEAAACFRDAGIKVRDLWQPKGCRACDGTGYLGRRALFELLVMNREWKTRLAADGATLRPFREAWEAGGRHSGILDGGLRLAADGTTSWEEVERVTMNLE